MERRLIDANDPILWRRSVKKDGYRYVPWEAIAEVPTAEVGNAGRWLKYKPKHYRCSVCGFEPGGRCWRYCPNCGARMGYMEV